MTVLEKSVDCSNCRMVGCGPGTYSAKTKCCTYRPFIPNFHMGYLLQSKNQYFESLLKAALLQRSWVLPMGWIPEHSYQKAFGRKNIEEFGNNPEFLCNFYDKGACRAWQGRGSQCVSFHCMSDYEAAGEEFWQILADCLHDFEMQISQEYMLHRGYTWQEVEAQIAVIKWDETMASTQELEMLEWSRFWAHHMDDAYNFFKESYNFIQNYPKQQKEANWASNKRINDLQRAYKGLRSLC